LTFNKIPAHPPNAKQQGACAAAEIVAAEKTISFMIFVRARPFCVQV
jgi:hypothetical protein